MRKIRMMSEMDSFHHLANYALQDVESPLLYVRVAVKTVPSNPKSWENGS
jgi:hypothetical protein